MPQGKDDEKLVTMAVKVPAHIRYGFGHLAIRMEGGKTELMTQFVEAEYEKRYGHFGLPMLKRNYLQTNYAHLHPEYDPDPDEPSTEPS